MKGNKVLVVNNRYIHPEQIIHITPIRETEHITIDGTAIVTYFKFTVIYYNDHKYVFNYRTNDFSDSSYCFNEIDRVSKIERLQREYELSRDEVLEYYKDLIPEVNPKEVENRARKYAQAIHHEIMQQWKADYEIINIDEIVSDKNPDIDYGK